MNQFSTLRKHTRTAKKTIKKAGRKFSARLMTVAAVGSMIPYKLEKEQNDTTGDGGYVLTSLLFRTEISPKCEDSEKDKTLVALRLRPMKEIRTDLKRAEEALKHKQKPVIIEEPVPLPEKDEKKLRKAEKKVVKIKRKLDKKRKKLTRKAAKEAAKQGSNA